MATTDGAADRRAIEYAKAFADVAYFVDTFCRIDDAQGLGDSGPDMPFKLWPAQAQVLWTLTTRRLVIILKARQLGISWLCCAYALWLCLFFPAKVVLFFSKGKDEANELLRRVGALYDRLPPWLVADLPHRIKDNTEEHAWSNGSRIKSMPATEGAGRSFTASLIVLDEFAHMTWGDKLYTAAKPTIDAGGQMIILSTAKGIGNAFHVLWIKAKRGASEFVTVFLPFWVRPGRDYAWRARQVEESVKPADVPQEYPATDTEAFVASGRARFKQEWVEKQAEGATVPIETIQALRNIPGVECYAEPVKGRTYFIAADVAEGSEDGDFDDGVVMDATTWKEVASIRGQWEPRVFATYLDAMSKAYNYAEIMPERNNHGHAVIGKLQDLGAMIGRGLDGKRGWLTNAKTKPQMIDFMAEALKDGLVQFNNSTTIHEMSIYETKADGGTGAPNGHHDDGVMSRAIICMKLGRKSGGYSF